MLEGSIIENMGGRGPLKTKVIESGVAKAPTNSPKRRVKKMKGNGLIFLYSLKKEYIMDVINKVKKPVTNDIFHIKILIS